MKTRRAAPCPVPSGYVKRTKPALTDTLRGLELLGKHLRLITQQQKHQLECNSNPYRDLLKVFARDESIRELQEAINVLNEVAPQ